MGTLWSTDPSRQGLEVNGVLLGEPAELDNNPLTYEWDHPAFPNGEILADGTVIPDEDGN